MSLRLEQIKEIADKRELLKVFQIWKYDGYHSWAQFHNMLTTYLGDDRMHATIIWDNEYGDYETKTLRLFAKLRKMHSGSVIIIKYLDTYCENSYHGKWFLSVLGHIAVETKKSIVVISRSPNEEPIFQSQQKN